MTREEQSVKMGKRLKALREETPLNGKKMSHEKLKEKLKEIYGVEISRDSLMNYEVSDVNHSKFGTNLKMNVEYLNCLSSFYGVSTDYLLAQTFCCLQYSCGRTRWANAYRSPRSTA